MSVKLNDRGFLHNELRKETTCRMQLPGREEGPGQGNAACVTETVLVAEDNHSLRALLSEGLRMQGYRILSAANGLQALQLAERHIGNVDALVTDVMMPYMRGTEVATRLTAIWPQLKVIFMSGCVYEGFNFAELLTTGSVFLQKPFTLEQLRRKLREALDLKRSITGTAPIS